MKTSVAILFCAFALGFASCQSMPGKGARVPVNSQCPSMPDHKVDPAVGVDFGGHWVAFCCADCKGDWEKMTTDQRQQFVNTALASKAK